MHGPIRTCRGVFVALAAAAAIAGCTPPVAKRGNDPDAEAMAEIQPGAQSKEDVQSILGSPSSVAAFDPNTWYYISKETEQIAFFQPDVLKQRVVMIRFDEAGMVQEVKELDKEAGTEVELVERETPTRGKDLTFLRQIISSLGFAGRDPLSGPPVYTDDRKPF